MIKRLSVKEIKKKYQNNESLVMLTAYDATQARLVDEVVDMILVGDSLGMTTLGFENTLMVTMDMMIHHTAAVVRGSQKAMVVADMPFLSCHLSKEDFIRNAGRFMQEAGASAVKIEGGKEMAGLMKAAVAAGIPVIGHTGLQPQNIMVQGGYHMQGKSEEEAERVIADALAIQEAGGFAVLLECIPDALASKITEMLTIPTIGIGAGKKCSGQVQVIHDILGCSTYLPKHAKKYADLSEIITNAATQYSKEVREKTF